MTTNSTDKSVVRAMISLVQSILATSAKYRNEFDHYTARQITLCVIDESEDLYTLIPSANSLFDLAEVYTRAYLKSE